jgi:hypothetical protein
VSSDSATLQPCGATVILREPPATEESRLRKRKPYNCCQPDPSPRRTRLRMTSLQPADVTPDFGPLSTWSQRTTALGLSLFLMFTQLMRIP